MMAGTAALGSSTDPTHDEEGYLAPACKRGRGVSSRLGQDREKLRCDDEPNSPSDTNSGSGTSGGPGFAKGLVALGLRRAEPRARHPLKGRQSAGPRPL